MRIKLYFSCLFFILPIICYTIPITVKGVIMKNLDKYIMKYILMIAVVVIVIMKIDLITNCFITIIHAFSNIIFAAMLAYVINIVMSRFETLLSKVKIPFIYKHRRIWSLLLSLIVIVLVIYSLINLVLPEFFKAIQVLLQTLPTYFNQVQDFLENVFKEMPKLSDSIANTSIDWKSFVSNILSIASSGVGSLLDTTFNMVSVITGSLFNFLLIGIFAIYLLLDKDRFKRLYHRLTRLYLPVKKQKQLDKALLIIHQSFSSFIGGQCIEAAILGTLCATGMFILQMPYALMIGILVGVINIIPIIGAYIGGAIGVFMVFTVSPMLSIGFLVFLIILQQFESNVIYPRVVGNSVGLPGVYVLASVMVFGTLAGIPGMFLGIPTVASIYKLSRIYIRHKEIEKGI